MAILEVLRFPDPRLRELSLPVKEVTAELQTLADDMVETMYSSAGIGLAAPQIGALVRLLVIDVRPKENGRYKIDEMTELEQAVQYPLIIFNPEIIKTEGSTTYEEGCLSVPSFYETVKRADYIECVGLDRQGQKLKFKADGLLAICLQHEIDHLDGKLFIDRLSLVKSNRIKSQIKKHGYPAKTKKRDSSEDDEHSGETL
jgi:peptide deformylase